MLLVCLQANESKTVTLKRPHIRAFSQMERRAK